MNVKCFATEGFIDILFIGVKEIKHQVHHTVVVVVLVGDQIFWNFRTTAAPAFLC